MLGSACVLATSMAAFAPSLSASAATSTKVVVIPFENQSYDDIVSSPQAPYLNSLIRQGTLFTLYTAVADGSNPNYLAMTGGLTAPVTPSSPNIFQAIDGTPGLSWKELMESMNGNCANGGSGNGSTGTVPGSTDQLYSTDHDPVVSAYGSNTTCATNDIPLTTASLSNLSNFTYLVPNECNDMHTPIPAGQSCPSYFGPNTGSSLINMGDNWLSHVVPTLLAQPNVTVIITFDEWNSNTGTQPWEHIATVEVGAGVTAGGFDSNPYTHYGLEAGLYRYFGLGTAPNNGATALALPIPASGAPPYPGQSNPVTKENSLPGTTLWELNGNKTVDDNNKQLDGYASLTSVNLGQPITFYVSTNPAQNVTMDIYRLGYYQGLGGRYMMTKGIAGIKQPACPQDSQTGMTACNWAASFTLTVPTTWTSGVFLAKLTNAAGYQNYIIFVVRDDARHSPLLYQLPFNTYQAYNNWPNDVPAGSTTGLPATGKDLYDQDSSTTLTGYGTQRAVQVSYDRPYSENQGAGPFLNWDINNVAWIEQQGYDASYATSIDTDLAPGSLLNHNGFISGAHDEYWSMTMYNNTASARDHGVNLAFFGADSVSWQVRMAANAAGAADRIVICFKSATLDPVQNNTITVHFHDPQVNVPEQLLVGGNSGGQQLGSSSATPAPYIVQNASNWIYTNTGAFEGESIPNVVGYEIQTYNPVFPAPTSAPGTFQQLSNSPIINSNNVQVFQNTTIYQAGSGAWVFNAASIEWGWALFDFGFSTGGDDHPDYANSFIQIMTANVLNKFSAGTLPLPAAPTNLRAVPSTSSVSLTWTDNDAAATLELDRSTDPAFSTFTAVTFAAGVTSYTDSGLTSAVYYYRLFSRNSNGESPYVLVNASTISYSALISARSSLLAHWRLGENTGTTAFDTTGNFNGTYVNSPTLGAGGAIANDPSTSVTFNGSTQRVTLPTVSATAGDFTIEGWTFLTTSAVNNNALYASNTSVAVLPRPGTAGFPTAAFVTVTLNGTAYVLQPNSPASNVNTWVYWVVTRKGNTLDLYRNGVQIAQRTDLPATASLSLNGYIAAQTNGAYFLTGNVQDVALYNQALSAEDVQNGYSAALNGVAPPPPLVYPNAPTNFAAVPSASKVALTWTDPDSTSNYWLYRGTDPNFSTPVTINLPAGTTSYTDTGLGQGVFYYKLVASNTGGKSNPVLASAATMSYNALVNGRSALVGHWRLGETSGTTAVDTTGVNAGIYVNSPTMGSPGAIARDPSTSVTFNGTSQRVTVPALPTVQDFTVGGWVYLTNATVNNNTIFGSGSMQLLARPGTGSFTTVGYAGVTLNGTLYILQPTSPASNINTWVYLVMTRQGSTLTLYRNGVQLAQRTDLPATATTSLSGYIANQSNGSYYLAGRLQDVDVYSRALSSLEVSNGYVAGVNGLAPAAAAPITTPYYNAVRSEASLMAYWRLGETSGTTAKDVMGKYNGTYVSSPTLGAAGAITNDPDKSATFNGTTQAVTLPTLATVQDFTVEAWANLTNATINNNALYSGGASSIQFLARPGTGSFVTAAYANVTLNGTSYVLQPNSPASNINNWVYFTLTRQGSTLTLYRNGVQIGQRTDLPATATVPLNGYIGEQVGGAYFLTGGIDEVAIYNTALTPQDIWSHYQAAQSGPAPNPTAAPLASVTQPATGSTYGTNWSGSITGTASSASGFSLTSVSVAVKDTTTGQWWNGTSFSQATQTFVPVSSGTTSWSLAFPASNLTSAHSYTATAQATDYVGNVGTSSAAAFTFNSAPPSASVSYPSNGATYGTNWSGSITGTASSNSGSSLSSVSVAVQDTTTGQWWSGSGFNLANQTFLPATGTGSWSFGFPAANLSSGHGYSVIAQATDGLGNAGTSSAVAFSFNTGAPTTTIACNGSACSSGWYTASISVTLSATSGSGSAINATYYTTDGSTPTTSSPVYSGPFTVSTSSTVQFFSVDRAGNVEAVKSQQLLIDGVPPTTAILCNGVGCSNTWFQGPVLVSLPASDNNGGSGVVATFYTTDGSTPTTSSSIYTAPFTTSSTSTVKFFSLDNAGNAEAVKSQPVQVDATAPSSNAACNATACSSGWYNATVSVTLSATDNVAGSGVNAIYYTTDGSTPTTASSRYTAAFSVSSTTTVKFFSVDNAGNVETVKSQQIQIDGVAPFTSISCNGSACSTGFYKDAVRVALSPTDNTGGSGVVATYYTTDGSTPTTSSTLYSGSFLVPSTSTIKFFSVDNAGNAEAVESQQVKVATLASIAVTPVNPSIAKGLTQQFTATGTYTDGSSNDISSAVAWSSSVPAVASINSSGLASGLGQGTSQISATSGGVTGSTTLTVGPPALVSIAVTPANPSIAKGLTQQFSATGTYTDGSTQDLTTSATWASSNTQVAPISSTGLATASAQGTTQISATTNSISGSTTLTVGPPALVSIALSPTNPSIPKGTTQQFAATGTYTDASTADLTNSVIWGSQTSSVATISGGGVASAVGQGTSQISATSGSVSASTTLTVGPAALVSIAVTPSNPSVAKGLSQQFTATGTYTDASTADLTSSVTWASSNGAVAPISSAGLASAAAQGSSQISATLNSISGSTTLTVGPAALASIAVTPTNPSIAKGTTQQFAATGTYTDQSTADLTSSVTWSSSNTAVASISSSGLASGTAQGTSQISATSGSISGSTTLTVQPAALVSIRVTPLDPTIALGNSQPFVATATYSDGSNGDVTSSASWTSANASVATISSNGVATSKAQGSSLISATVNGITGSSTLTVGPAVLASIAVTPANPSIPKGTTQQFTATGTYSDGSTTDLTGSVTWASSNSSVASISSSGLASGVAQGSATITATSGAINGTTTLTVTPPAPVSIAVSPANPSVALGIGQAFSATATYTDGSTGDVTNTVAWSSSDTGVATIGSGGFAASKQQGTTTITATSGALSSNTTLTVTPATLVSIAVTPANPSIPLGTTQQFTATGSYTDGSTQDLTNSVTWASTNGAVASISASGLATSSSQGSTQISASLNGITGTTNLTVGPAALVSIAVTPVNPSIAKGTTQQFAATGTYTDGSTADVTGSVVWASSNGGVASISAGGVATGTGQGSAQISATSGSVSDSTTLNVGPALLVSISITPSNPSIALGRTQQFTATGTYTDASTQDLTSSVSWTSATPGVATISNSGLANSVSQGSSQMTATAGGISGSTTLTVGPPVLVSIAVNPANPTIAKGLTQQFSATGTYSDGSTQDVSGSVTWASSNSAVATINASGLASGAGQGTSQISAATAGVTGSTTLTVAPPALVSIAVTPASPTIPQGSQQQFSAIGTYTDGSTVDVTSVSTWASATTAVATINSGGLATGTAQGTSQISATMGAISGNTTLTVGPAALVSIAVTPANPSIPKGLTQQFTATGTYTDGTTQNLTSTSTWASANTAVATITSGGLATGAGQGTSQISAKVGSVSGSTTLTVTAPALVSIAVTPANKSIPKGTTQQFTATGTYTDASTLDITSSVAWSSSVTSVAPITSGGLASGSTQGSSQISATQSGITGGTTLTVGPAALASIAVTPANPSIAKGTTQQFTATGTYTDATTQNLTSSAIWASSNTSVATITSSGLATAVNTSTSQISATSGSVTGSTTLTVGPAVLVSIAVTPANPSIPKGSTQQFTATGTYSDGSTQNLTTSATWASATTSIATINATGLATAVAQGTSQISATQAGVTNSTTLTVGPAALVSIAVTPANPAIPKGNTQQFTATGTYTDGSTLNLTSSATWASSNTTVATITSTGLATGANVGTSTISATSGTIKGSTTLTVNAAALVSIAVTPANQSVPRGTTVQYTATGTYTDGSKQNLTTSVTWTSSNTSVVSINSSGLATTLKRGTVTITAKLGTVSGSTTLKST